MKALTILEPWASLIAQQKKHLETRSWNTNHRGLLAIHAGISHWHVKRLLDDRVRKINIAPFDPSMLNAMVDMEGNPLMPPFGHVLAVAELVDCVEMTRDRIQEWRSKFGNDEIAFGDFAPGRYAWILRNVQAIKPVRAKGHQGLWDWRGKYELLDGGGHGLLVLGLAHSSGNDCG